MPVNPCLPPKIDDGPCQKRIANFSEEKREQLSEWIQENSLSKEEAQGIQYSTEHFREFVKTLNDVKASGVRMYFASYLSDAFSKDYIPENSDFQLTLIFSPTQRDSTNNDCDKREQNTGNYYLLIPDDKGDSSSAKMQGLVQLKNMKEIKMGIGWINLYETKIEEVLENADKVPYPPKKGGETRSIWFGIDTINEWMAAIDENDSQNPDKPIKNVLIKFATYSVGDMLPDPAGMPGRRPIKHQLTIIVTILPEGENYTSPFFYDANLLLTAEEKSNLTDEMKFTLLGGYYDTGKPCPPPTNGCS